MPQEEL